MKRIVLYFILFFAILVLFGCGNKEIYNTYNNISNNTVNNTNIGAERLSLDVPKEEPLAEFTTTIYDADDERQTNMTLCCNTLNGTIVKSGETFSFNDTVRTSYARSWL